MMTCSFGLGLRGFFYVRAVTSLERFLLWIAFCTVMFPRHSFYSSTLLYD